MDLKRTSTGIVTDRKFLSQYSAPVESRDEMLEIMGKLSEALNQQKNCVGLAAVQIGILSRIAIYDLPGYGRNFLVNPEIVAKNGSYIVTPGERCMSLPGVSYSIRRADFIQVITDIDPFSKKDVETRAFWESISFSGFAAAAIQHEIDHMNGITVIDRIRLQRKQGAAGLRRSKRK